MTNSLFRIVLATLIVGVLAGAAPADAGGYVGLSVTNHGVSVGFGSSNWGIWGSSWNSGSASLGFSATLAGYGEWVSIDGLGQVWRPWVAAGWQPYTHGRWVWTSIGWTWVAYEPWGWAPHHYGNWAYSTIGWVWSPGYVYHPGNVVWVGSGAHVGWYPCGPRGWSHYHRGYRSDWHAGYANGHANGYSHGYADGWRDARYATWVPRSRVTADNVANHVVRHDVATHAVARSRVTTMAGGPSRSEIEHAVGRTVPEARIVEGKARIDGRDVRVVRPEGQAETVQRHGGATVSRALAPAARERVSGAPARSVRSTEARSPNPPKRADTPSETATRRSTESRRGSSPAAVTRNRTVSSPKSDQDAQNRSTARIQSGSHQTRPREATDRRRSVGHQATSKQVAPQPRSPATTAPRAQSVSTSKRAETGPGPAQQPTTRNRRSTNDRPQGERSPSPKKTEDRSKKRRRAAPTKG